MAWAESASGGYPAYVGRGAAEPRPAAWPRARVPGHRRDGRRSSTRTAAGPVDGYARGRRRASSSKSLGEAERDTARAGARSARRAPTTSSRSAAASSAISPGFCAAVYQRGIPVVQVPTTLVAQVDSAYGGKTGVDLPEAKNYVGAYHLPAAVLADPDALVDAAAGRADGRVRRGAEDGADRGRRSLGARSRAGDSLEQLPARPAHLRLRSHEARGRRRRRARRRPPPGAQPRPHGGPRDRGRVPATGATATARRSASGCSPRSSSPTPPICATRSRRSSNAHGTAHPARPVGRARRRDRRRSGATRSGPPTGSRSCSVQAPGDDEPRPPGRAG